MITGVAFVPSTPLLVPEVSAGASPELDDVRAACDRALGRLLDTDPDRIVVVGAGRETREHRAGTGSLRGFGVAFDVALDPSSPATTRATGSGTTSSGELPLSLTIGAWLLERVDWRGERAALELDERASQATLAAVATALAGEPFRSALLVVADGSAARSVKAPASLHPDAEAFDATVATALASGRPSDLTAVSRERATAVSAAGWPAWFVAATTAAVSHDGPWLAQVDTDVAPYGVGYFVATWLAV